MPRDEFALRLEGNLRLPPPFHGLRRFHSSIALSEVTAAKALGWGSFSAQSYTLSGPSKHRSLGVQPNICA
jgi:hypothetical protein